MWKKYGLILVFLVQFGFSMPSTVQQINKSVDSIDVELKSESLEKSIFKTQTQAEVSPPEITFYHSDGHIKAAIAVMQHEGWENKFFYYFDRHEKPLKYLKITTRPDEKNKRQSIIFDTDGKVVWKNTDTMPLKPNIISNIFRNLWSASIGISKY